MTIVIIKNGEWYWGLGDTSISAWGVTFLYAICSFTCLLAWNHSKRSHIKLKSTNEITFWLGTCLFLFLLCVNKQGDFQELITHFGRKLFRHLGYYEHRRFFQAAFIVMMTIVALVGSTSLFRQSKNWNRCCRIVALGLCFQLAFIVIRAASFHHLDVLLFQHRLADLKVNLLIESLGLGIILVGAGMRCRRA